MSIRVREATEQDIPAIARICSAAFHPTTDVIARQLFPLHLQPKDVPDGDTAYSWRTVRKSCSLSSSQTAMVVAIDDGNDQIVGFALWDLPISEGVRPATNLKQTIPEPPEGFDRVAYAELRTVVAADHQDTFGARGLRDVWHLDYLGVDPQQQRRGIGRVLLEWGIDRAASEGKDCYLLATPAGRSLYAAAGFQDVSIFGVKHYSMILRHA